MPLFLSFSENTTNCCDCELPPNILCFYNQNLLLNPFSNYFHRLPTPRRAKGDHPTCRMEEFGSFLKYLRLCLKIYIGETARKRKVVRKCVVLNNLELTPKKVRILHGFVSEYKKVLCRHFLQSPFANSSVDLHGLTYSGIRKTSFLPSDIVQEARKDAWKMEQVLERNGFNGININRVSVRLNKRWFRYVKTQRGKPCFKITYAKGKTFTIPIRTDAGFERFNKLLGENWQFANISLLENGRIAVILEQPITETINKQIIVGIDIGSEPLASATVFDSGKSKVVKQLYFGQDISHMQRRFETRRTKLKSIVDKGSHRARQSLRRMGRKQSNFVKTRSGQVASQIVKFAKSYDADIAIEKLRLRSDKFSKKANRIVNTIPYGHFREFLISNCHVEHISLHIVDPYHTSKWCSGCGAINDGHHSGNYSLYKCANCGMVANSDRKASLAVAVKSLLERKSHSFTNLSSFQISNRRVPVNALLRSDDVGVLGSVNHEHQPMESHLTC